jgi:hypothetical protein
LIIQIRFTFLLNIINKSLEIIELEMI